MTEISQARLAVLGDIAPLTAQAGHALACFLAGLPSERDTVLLANLEAPVAGSEPATHKIRLSIPEEAIAQLASCGVTVVNLANNHILDYGQSGLSRTLALLDAHGIRWTGLTSSHGDQEPLVIERSGCSFAFLGFVARSTHPVLGGHNAPGPAVLELERVRSHVRRAVASAEYVIVSMHWGLQNQPFPTPVQVECAHAIAGAGAHAIVGHHAHVLQGYEKCERAHIFYGLGNLLFPDVRTSYAGAELPPVSRPITWFPINRVSAVPIFSCRGEELGLERVCFSRQDPQAEYVALLGARDHSRLERYLRRISQPIERPSYSRLWPLLLRWFMLVDLLRRWRKEPRLLFPTGGRLRGLCRRLVLGKHPEADKP